MLLLRNTKDESLIRTSFTFLHSYAEKKVEEYINKDGNQVVFIHRTGCCFSLSFGNHIQPYVYSKTCVKRPLTIFLIHKSKIFDDDKGRKYCRMLPLEHSAILLTYNKR